MQSKLFIHVVGDGGRISDIVPRSRRRPRNEAYTVARRRQMTAVSPEGSETMEQRRRRNPRHMWMRWDWILAPPPDIVKGLLLCYVVDQQCSHRTPVIRTGYGTVPLLTCGIMGCEEVIWGESMPRRREKMEYESEDGAAPDSDRMERIEQGNGELRWWIGDEQCVFSQSRKKKKKK
ncbi:hypothetical protein BHE74_00027319 [Ensete ventricosum]|nr:hypothetical protein BHE74_00027319 [Ensete ventricosum]RZR96761.1 hypothetical protein BHM03_00025824 [Ensete ventricosum]